MKTKNNNELASGKTVTVYQIPLTAEKPDGKAELIQRVDSRAYTHRPEFEVWKVQFEGQDEPVNRIVSSAHILQEA